MKCVNSMSVIWSLKSTNALWCWVAWKRWCIQQVALVQSDHLCLFVCVLIMPILSVMGGFGCFTAFPSSDEIEFYHSLEMHMRQENPPLCGRDHMAYRSFYFPVKVFFYIYIQVFEPFFPLTMNMYVSGLCWRWSLWTVRQFGTWKATIDCVGTGKNTSGSCEKAGGFQKQIAVRNEKKKK